MIFSSEGVTIIVSGKDVQVEVNGLTGSLNGIREARNYTEFELLFRVIPRNRDQRSTSEFFLIDLQRQHGLSYLLISKVKIETYFEVGNSCIQLVTPIHQPVGSVDGAIFVQTAKCFDNGF